MANQSIKGKLTYKCLKLDLPSLISISAHRSAKAISGEEQWAGGFTVTLTLLPLIDR